MTPDKGNRNHTLFSSNKKIIIYAIIGIVIISVVVITFGLINNTSNPINRTSPGNTTFAQQSAVIQSKNDAISKFDKIFCGHSKANSNQFITEYKLPYKCEMPLGIAIEDGSTTRVNNSASSDAKVWYVSVKNGSLGSYDIKNKKFDREHIIPIWKPRQSPIDYSQVWTLKIDQKGNIWFTDEKQNALWKYIRSSQTFEMYPIPAKSSAFGTTYPVSLDFDKNGDIYFVGIRSPYLWFGDVARMKNNTSSGITSIPIPITGFKGIDPDLISTGSLTIDTKHNVVWISMLAYPQKGQIFRYHIDTKTFDTFDMPKVLSSPVGTAVDESGNLWVTDHGTSLFYMLNPLNNSITLYVTSKASDRIFGGNNISAGNYYTLPYWIQIGHNGSILFNEHTGNKIAQFNPVEKTLVEYWIPTQNKAFSSCPIDNKTSSNSCGIANALQLTTSKKSNQLWFTEWSENKIGKVDKARPLPFYVTINPQGVVVNKGHSKNIKVNIVSNSSSVVDLNMLSSGTFTPTGDLGNSTGIFSQESISIAPGQTKEISYIFTPRSDLNRGDYMLMLGAENDSVSYMRAIRVTIL